MTDTIAAVARAEARHEEAALNQVCAAVGIGLRTLQSRDRTDDTARRRAVVAWILMEEGWDRERIARALHRSRRTVQYLIKKR